MFPRNCVVVIAGVCLSSVLVGHSNVRGDETTKNTWSDGEKLFALEVKQLFVDKCLACHGDDPQDIQSGLDMRSRAAMLRGGDAFEGDVLIAGQGQQSFLHRVTTRRVSGFEMPPKESESLTDEQMAWIRRWIDSGAPWPDEDVVELIRNEYAQGEIVPTSGGLGDDWTNRRYPSEKLWAYRPLQKVFHENLQAWVDDPPTDSNQSSSAGSPLHDKSKTDARVGLRKDADRRNPIDWFINRRLRQANLTAAGDATSLELCRRLTFGLTGLPPTAEQQDDFGQRYESNPRAAVRRFAQDLMASPQYGEHFGRHWLDVSRYADSAGFANDYSRPNAWRYRDYVIRSFNDDKPFNDFVREQIAGDEIAPDDPEHQIATGFLRMGPWEQTGMSVFRVTRQQWLDDVTDSVGQAFLAHPLQCCKCHDHKFDPLPTRDYYSVMAVFSTTQFGEPDVPFVDRENLAGLESADEWTRAKIAAYNQQLKQLQTRIDQQRTSEDAPAKLGDNGLDPGDEASQSRMKKNISRHRWELDKTQPIALSVYTGKTITRNNIQNRLTIPSDPWGKGSIQDDTIFDGGDVFSPGQSVSPGAISAAENLGEMPALNFPDGQGERRLALADWIVHPKNPLTARVIVNRIWAWHFGRGIAGNPNNFGATGRAPTHPELLDYLAGWFIKNGWSIKKLNQLIVTSDAFRRSSRHRDPEELARKDPKGDLYATFLPRRLTAEELRDAILACTGELNRQVGGIPCRPDLNREVAMQPRQIMGGIASVYEPDPLPRQRNRRSVYTEKLRGLRDPFYEAFNQPGTDKSCELRETSTVAPQALTLLNATEMQDRSFAFAASLMKSRQSDAEMIHEAFLRSLGRRPNEAELGHAMKHWAAATTSEASKSYRPIRPESEIKRTVMAEKTGEPYDFIEIMPAYKDYVPDVQPSDLDAKTRGLAQVCLVLLNLNEFIYLD